MSVWKDGSFRMMAAAALATAVACSHPAPASAPAPEVAPPPAAPAAPPPNAVAGTFALQAVIQGRTIPAPPPQPRRPSRGRTVTAPLAAVLQLTPTPAAAPDPSAPSSTQLRAEVSLPGYTMPPRGRTTQAAAWWPGRGDSVTVRWVTPRNAAVSLRGTLRGDTLSGDVWYTLLDSGSEFQLGTWIAVRRRTGR
ncbi:MAG: hypothetical protein ABSB58_00415 [Gemmatimonadales bacterium]|jgi:hypothetical protein